ncbi:MAG: hypothetical protein ACTHMO_12485 [Rhodanobacteraceae bacterium]
MNASFRKWIKPGTSQTRIYVNGVSIQTEKVYIVASDRSAIGFEIVVYSAFGQIGRDAKDTIINRVEDAAREKLGAEINPTYADYLKLAA